MHAARLLRVPCASFWGPTAPATRLRPVAGLDEVVHYRPPVCSPCVHVAETPPCQGDNVCMRLFTNDEPPAAAWCEDATGAAAKRHFLSAADNASVADQQYTLRPYMGTSDGIGTARGLEVGKIYETALGS